MQNRAEVELAVAAGADAVGCVGQRPPSPRTVPDAEIAAILPVAPPPVARFVLSSERTAEAILQQVRDVGVNAVQMIACPDAAEVARLAVLAPELWRVQVIHVEGPAVLDLIPLHAPHVHAFLLDSGSPSGPTPRFGGTGETHDWAVSAAFVRASPRPVYLAGGLSAANVAAAIAQVRPFAVDVCSGVRTEGRLDPTKLEPFMAAVRCADAARAP